VRLVAVAARHGLGVTAIGFNPVRSEYRVAPALNAWERAHRLSSPEGRTAHVHMTTYGPDLNLSWAGATPDELVDAARKLTSLSPCLVPLSFSSPFRDGRPWGGLSARTHVRTGVRPAALAFLAEGVPHVPADPSLTRTARLPAEVGRLEFKAFDACPDPELYGELLSLLTGLVLDRTLPARRTTPDTAAHQRAACDGYADPALRAAAEVALEAAATAVTDRPADAARVKSLRARFDRGDCPAREMLARYEEGHPVAGLHPAARL
jgi:gamma-glutamyl:cysteine ligase YbdK (ATP-grasp superfamily)